MDKRIMTKIFAVLTLVLFLAFISLNGSKTAKANVNSDPETQQTSAEDDASADSTEEVESVDNGNEEIAPEEDYSE